MYDALPGSNVPMVPTESNISLRDIVFVLFRRRWVILAIALPIILVAGISLTRQTGSFTASSRIVVELLKVDLPRWNTQGRTVDYDRELSTFINIAMSLPVAEKAAASLADSIPIMQSLVPDLSELDQEGALLEYLQEGLNVSIVGESAIIEFSFSSSHPRISMMASGAYRDAFINFQIYGRKNVEAIAYYEEQITSVRAEIDSLLVIRGRVLHESGYSSLKDELRYETGHVADLESQLSAAIINTRTLEAHYGLLVKYLENNPRDFPMGPDESRSQTLVNWRDIVGKYDNELSAILVVSTDDSVPARQQRQIVENALANLKREQHNYVNSYQLTLFSAQEREKTIRQQLERVKSDSHDSPDVYQHVSLLDTEIETLRGLFEDLQSKRGEVRLNQMADERVSSVVILTNPEISTVISGSKTMVYLVVIILFAIAFGIVMAFVLENLDHRIYSPRDIEQNLNLPVFASVSKVD